MKNMSESQVTKKALAASMKKLMQEQPMKKISISDIVKGCNMNRQSFYYHFQDKYDLVNWIFYTELVLTIRDISTEKMDIKMDILRKICDYLYDNKTFYKNAFEVKGQNSFSEYFRDILHSILETNLSAYFKNDKSNNNVEFYASFYADAIQISIEKWLREDPMIPPDEYVNLVMSTIEIGANYLHGDGN